ncbi:hypothetical protein HDU93_005904, partial [Gonapodya sp. JEL0774]
MPPDRDLLPPNRNSVPSHVAATTGALRETTEEMRKRSKSTATRNNYSGYQTRFLKHWAGLKPEYAAMADIDVKKIPPGIITPHITTNTPLVIADYMTWL